MQQVANNRRAPESPETWGGSTRFFRVMEKLFFAVWMFLLKVSLGSFLAE